MSYCRHRANVLLLSRPVMICVGIWEAIALLISWGIEKKLKEGN